MTPTVGAIVILRQVCNIALRGCTKLIGRGVVPSLGPVNMLVSDRRGC